MREFHYNTKHVKIYMWLAIFCTPLSLFLLFVPSGRSNVAMILPVFMYFLYRKLVVVRAYDDHLELKLAPLQSLRIVNFNEIIDVMDENKKLILHLKDGKKIKIPYNLFNIYEREDFKNTLLSIKKANV